VLAFFSDKGDLLCVIFDEVQADNDHQVLEFDRDRIDVRIIKGKVEYKVTERKLVPRLRKRVSSRKQTI
jgi:hypothetical protein